MLTLPNTPEAMQSFNYTNGAHTSESNSPMVTVNTPFESLPSSPAIPNHLAIVIQPRDYTAGSPSYPLVPVSHPLFPSTPTNHQRARRDSNASLMSFGSDISSAQPPSPSIRRFINHTPESYASRSPRTRKKAAAKQRVGDTRESPSHSSNTSPSFVEMLSDGLGHSPASTTFSLPSSPFSFAPSGAEMVAQSAAGGYSGGVELVNSQWHIPPPSPTSSAILISAVSPTLFHNASEFAPPNA